MTRGEAQKTALQLYEEVITHAGYGTPAAYADLLDIVRASDAEVVFCVNPPSGFTGVQIGDVLYVNGSDAVSDHQRLRILAHEWCHWLRRRARHQHRHVRLYQGRDAAEGRDREEEIARAFERLF